MKNQLSDVINLVVNTNLEKINVSLPGKIESYDATKKKASVKPLIKKKLTDGTFLSMPVIVNVPVIHPGTNDAIIHLPIKRGDGCLLIFSQRSLEKFLSQTTLNEVQNDDIRKFSLSDAFCIMGLFPFGSPGKTANSNNDLEINYKNASIVIGNDGTIKLNGETKSFVTHTELNAALQAMVTALNANFALKLDGGGTPGTVTIDITASKTNTVKTGG